MRVRDITYYMVMMRAKKITCYMAGSSCSFPHPPPHKLLPLFTDSGVGTFAPLATTKFS